jgi:tetratricopeptide (TPR) repeat protein
VATLLFLLAGLAAMPQKDAAQAHFERGRALYEEHDDTGDALREAEVEFRRALKLNPRMAAAVAYLGFIALEQDRPAEAEAAFGKALALDSRSPEARLGLARLHIRAGRNQDGIREARAAVAADPKHPLALRELAAYLSGENFKPTDETWREAIGCWETLVRLDANDRDAHHALAQGYERFRRWADAQRHYREVLRIGQTDDDLDVWVYSVRLNVAEMLERQGKTQEAIREYEIFLNSEGAGTEEIEKARTRIRILKKS